MYQVKSRVIKNEEVAEGYFRLSLECPEVAEKAIPGQFVMLRVGNSYDPLLRRPFSIHRIIKGSGIEILYKIIGKGTGMMAHIRSEDEVDLIGPLGRGFYFAPELKEALIVGGGIGAAPMLALTEELRNKGKDVKVFLGGRSKVDILCKNEFEQLGADVYPATDDGSSGYAGFVTGLLEDYIKEPSPLPSTLTMIQQRTANVNVVKVFSCGPHLMSKRVAEIAKGNNISCQVSLEAHMACGVGACLGCVIKTKGSGVRGQGSVLNQPLTTKSPPGCGCDSDYVPCSTQVSETSYKRVCMEGPVFDAEEVAWE